MKRLLILLSLACALFIVSACSYDVNLSVEADAELYYFEHAKPIILGPTLYEGFHHKSLTDNDLEEIFLDLTKDAKDNFSAAYLHLRLYDEIGGKFVGEETYSVVFDSRVRHYVFTEKGGIY